MKKDLLNLRALTELDYAHWLKLALQYKAERHAGKPHEQVLAGKSIGMIFAKSSTRTRLSFEIGIHELGGHAMYLEEGKLQIGRGETIHDTAKVMSRYMHGIVIRTFSHDAVVELAEHATIPVINALTDLYHPCQVLADLMTIHEYSGRTQGVKLVYIGDGACNMPNSLMLGAILSGINLTICAPEPYKPNFDLIKAMQGPGSVHWEKDPVKAVQNADYVYTDVWVSMGCEAEAQERLALLAPYQVNDALLAHAKKEVKVLHCLPAKREEEITDDVMDGPHSIVFDEAENRLHAQKAILAMLLGGQ